MVIKYLRRPSLLIPARFIPCDNSKYEVDVGRNWGNNRISLSLFHATMTRHHETHLLIRWDIDFRWLSSSCPVNKSETEVSKALLLHGQTLIFCLFECFGFHNFEEFFFSSYSYTNYSDLGILWRFNWDLSEGSIKVVWIYREYKVRCHKQI